MSCVSVVHLGLIMPQEGAGEVSLSWGLLMSLFKTKLNSSRFLRQKKFWLLSFVEQSNGCWNVAFSCWFKKENIFLGSKSMLLWSENWCRSGVKIEWSDLKYSEQPKYSRFSQQKCSKLVFVISKWHHWPSFTKEPHKLNFSPLPLDYECFRHSSLALILILF